MSSPFTGISIASTALRSFQRAMDVTGNNLANVNTDGYSRQTVTFANNQPITYYSNGAQQLGMGVNIAQISRVKDMFLAQSQNQNTSDNGKSSVLSAGLTSIDQIYGEPGSGGIATSLSNFWNAFSGLAANPSSGSQLASAQAAAQGLADNVRGKYSDLNTLGTQTTAQINQSLSDVQSLANQIAALNTQISQVIGGPPNDLLDKRDLAVNQLAQIVNITTSPGNSNTMNVQVGGFSLVENGTANTFPTTYDPTTSSVSNGSTTYTISSGQLAGEMATLNAVNLQKGQLDTIANTLRTQVNAITQSGTNSKGATGVSLFNGSNAPPQTGAIDFDLSAAAKADYNNIPTGTSGKAGDGGIAQQLSDMQKSSFASLGNLTFANFYQGNVTTNASKANYEQGIDSTNQALGQQIQNQVASISGVSVDDEMANMLKFQKAYSASAKMVSVCDQMLSDTISMLNR